MKKFFLFSSVALTFALASAQPQHASRITRSDVAAARVELQKQQMNAQSLMVEKQQTIAPAAVMPTSFEKNLYYAKPAGSLYYNYDAEFMGYYPTIVSVAPFTEFSFTDKSTPAATKWMIGTNDITSYVENGAFTNELEYGYGMEVPTISNRNGSFMLGENNEDAASYPSRIAAWGETRTLGFVDDHTGYYAWGSLDNDNLYGTGYLDNNGKGGECIAIVQDFPKPATPLYCESIIVPATRIGNSVGTIYIEIYNLESEEEDPVYTLVATDEDVVFDQPTTRNGKSIRFTKLMFNNIVIDEDGFESQEPFVLDFASEFVVTWEEGSDFGGMGVELQAEDYDDFGFQTSTQDLNYGLFAINYPDGVKLHYYSGLAFYCTFVAYQDNVLVPTTLTNTQTGEVYENCNVVKVSDDGESADSPLGEGWVMVYVADTDLENYEMEAYGDAEWVTIYTDTTGLAENSVFYITFRGEALPEGVTGRQCELYILGRGVQNEDPIIVYQGVYDPAGINTVNKDAEKEDDTIYNMMGVKVANKEGLASGIYVRNGKKFIQ